MIKEKLQKAKDWIRTNSKSYFVDSTAMLAESTPIFAAYETLIAGMSDEVSMNARLISAGLTYGGFGYLVPKGRDKWREFFKVNDKSKESRQMFHDTAYLVAFNLAMAPAVYYASGSRDLKEIVIGTTLGMLVGGFNGAPLGYAVDGFRDLTGIRNCERPSYPSVLKNLNSKTKKSLAALALAGSIGLTAGIYSLTPNEETSQKENLTTINQVSDLEKSVTQPNN